MDINAMSSNYIREWSEIEGPLSIKGIEDKYVRENMALLLNNQKSQDLGKALFAESFDIGVGAPAALDTGFPDSGNYGSFAPIALALVRRVFPHLFANTLVGVQAMTGPVGLAYALRFVYDDSLNEAAWDVVPEYSGYTGSTVGTSSSAVDTGTGVSTSAGETWKLQGSPAMPELQLKLDRTAIIALTRKLAASFSLEAAQDIKAMHGLDIEREMLNVLQYEMAAEMDRETIQKCRDAAPARVTWDVGSSAADGRWSQEKFTNITTQIIKASNDLATANRRGAGNIVVVSGRLATALQASGPIFTRNQSNVNATQVVPEIGTINGNIKVFRDQYATEDEALVAYKGPGVTDAGVIFCPYITGLKNRAIAHDDFAPRIGVMSRYAFTNNLLGSQNYYRRILFSNLNTLV
jgi:hypothetical protein